jgi:hypothetical protein
MSIQNNIPFNHPCRFDFEQKACYLVKCAVAVAVVQSLAKHIFGVDRMVLVAAICFVASEIVKGVVNHVRIDGVIAHHNLVGRGNL